MENNEKPIEYWNLDDDVYVTELSVTYSQKADCCQDNDESQYITLASVDNGIEPFIRISIPEGKFWSIDGTEDLADLKKIIKDFQKKLNFIEKK